MQENIEANADEPLNMIMKTLWKAEVPLKENFFSWKLFQDRLPARFQLFKRGPKFARQHYAKQHLRHHFFLTLGNAFKHCLFWRC